MRVEKPKKPLAAFQDSSDEELMDRFKDGSEAAFEELISRYGKQLYGFLCRQSGNADRADEAYQEVFVKVVRSAKRYKSRDRFAAWLFTIARNVCIDMARRDKHRQTEPLDDPSEEGRSYIETVAHDDPDPEENTRAAELAALLEDSLSSLSEEQREVFLLRERAGLSFKEIAEMTGAPLNTVKTRMHYAVNNLKKSLAASGYFGDD
ncbi:MAG: RNA polymerase sigma factor [bacterium]